MTYDDCKKQVAEMHGFESFWHLEQRYPKAIYRFYAEAAELYMQAKANEAVKDYFQFRPVDEWHEDMGDCLFYQTPMCEAPMVTCPLSSDWIEDYFTHFLEMKKFPVPDEDGSAIPGNSRDKYWTPFPDEK